MLIDNSTSHNLDMLLMHVAGTFAAMLVFLCSFLTALLTFSIGSLDRPGDPACLMTSWISYNYIYMLILYIYIYDILHQSQTCGFWSFPPQKEETGPGHLSKKIWIRISILEIQRIRGILFRRSRKALPAWWGTNEKNGLRFSWGSACWSYTPLD